MLELEKKYLDLLGVKIRNTYKDRVQIPCPICNEGKSKYKARGFVYDGDPAKYMCFNECGSMTFANMLGQIDQTLKSNYLAETRKDRLYSYEPQDLSAFNEKPKIVLDTEPVPKSIEYRLKRYKVIPLNETTVNYLKSRKIDESLFRDFK